MTTQEKTKKLTNRIRVLTFIEKSNLATPDEQDAAYEERIKLLGELNELLMNVQKTDLKQD